MAKTVRPVPEGYHTVTPYLIVEGASRALDFYQRAFGARLLDMMEQPDGRVGHAELQIGDSRVMLADEFPEIGAKAPGAFGGSPVSILLYVEDVDGFVAQATRCGAEVIRPVADQFYGDRLGMLKDPFGHVWSVATHVEDVPPEERKKRAAAAHQQ